MLVKGRNGAIGRFQIIQFMPDVFWRWSEAAERQTSIIGIVREDTVDGAPTSRGRDAQHSPGFGCTVEVANPA